GLVHRHGWLGYRGRRDGGRGAGQLPTAGDSRVRVVLGRAACRCGRDAGVGIVLRHQSPTLYPCFLMSARISSSDLPLLRSNFFAAARDTVLPFDGASLPSGGALTVLPRPFVPRSSAYSSCIWSTCLFSVSTFSSPSRTICCICSGVTVSPLFHPS